MYMSESINKNMVSKIKNLVQEKLNFAEKEYRDLVNMEANNKSEQFLLLAEALLSRIESLQEIYNEIETIEYDS